MDKKMTTREILLTASPLKLIISLSLPAIIGMMVVGLYNLMDAVFAGQMVGADAKGVKDLRIIFSTYIALGFLITVIILFQSLGNAAKASILVVLRQIAFFIPLAIIITKVNGFGIHGVFIAPALTHGIICVMSIFMTVGEFRKMSKLNNMEALSNR